MGSMTLLGAGATVSAAPTALTPIAITAASNSTGSSSIPLNVGAGAAVGDIVLLETVSNGGPTVLQLSGVGFNFFRADTDANGLTHALFWLPLQASDLPTPSVTTAGMSAGSMVGAAIYRGGTTATLSTRYAGPGAGVTTLSLPSYVPGSSKGTVIITDSYSTSGALSLSNGPYTARTNPSTVGGFFQFYVFDQLTGTFGAGTVVSGYAAADVKFAYEIDIT